MAAITYPTNLPAPSRWVGAGRDRLGVSSLPGNTQLRNRIRDALQEIEVSWMYDSAQMAIWREWYEDTLLDGELWFAATVPGAGGYTSKVLRFRTKTLKRTYNQGNGVYTVSAQVQQRGLSEPPLFIRPAQTLISQTATWLYFSTPTSDTTDYSAPGFDDSAWTPVPQPIGDIFAYGVGWPNANTIPSDRSKLIWMRKHVTATRVGIIDINTVNDNLISAWINGVPLTWDSAILWSTSKAYTSVSTSLVFAVKVTNVDTGAGFGPGNPIQAGLSAVLRALA